jgi:hypothetical protein
MIAMELANKVVFMEVLLFGWRKKRSILSKPEDRQETVVDDARGHESTVRARQRHLRCTSLQEPAVHRRIRPFPQAKYTMRPMCASAHISLEGLSVQPIAGKMPRKSEFEQVSRTIRRTGNQNMTI